MDTLYMHYSVILNMHESSNQSRSMVYSRRKKTAQVFRGTIRRWNLPVFLYFSDNHSAKIGSHIDIARFKKELLIFIEMYSLANISEENATQ